MKDKVYIIAVVVIVCLIFWRKSIVNKRGKDQKSIDTSSKAKNYSKKEDLHKMSETRTNEETFFKKAPEVKKKEAKDLKDKAEVESKKLKEEAKYKSQEVKAEEVKKEAEVTAEELKEEAKDLKKKSEVKAEEKKTEAQAKTQEVKKDISKHAENLEKNPVEVKEEIKEEKPRLENNLTSTGKYPDLITSIKNNPWTAEDLNTRVKFEDTRRQKTLNEEEITDLPLEKIKTSLRPDSIADFLNKTGTKPTVLKRKDDISYEFTSRDKGEIDLIKNRYGLTDRDIDKITSILIFDKEGQKLKEVKDILAEEKNRIYMETKF